ncbi:acyltransferase family protein [Hallella colorans]|uniref:acyltransferase family protein n=1 Tax=Hallella colorans TaxID=1703337 RepID=UPI00248E593D|nr:acyltransferase [Hallella colorans]
MPRIQYVDRLKGFAMLAVIFGHIYFFFIYDKDFYIAYFLSTFHMPLFMFLSGWVISSPPNFSKLLVKIASFVSPFLFVGSAFVLFYHKELSTLFESEVKNGYWYLFVLSIFYIFLYTYNAINHFIKFKWDDIVWALLVFSILIIFDITLSKKWYSILSIYQLRSFWPLFIAGYLFRKYNLTETLITKNIVFSCCMIAYAVTVYFFTKGFFRLFLFSAFLSVPTFVYLFKKFESNSGVVSNTLAKIGRHSLDIYIYHFFFVYALRLSGWSEYFIAIDNMLLEYVIAVAFSITIAYCSMVIGYLIRQSEFLENLIYGRYIANAITSLNKKSA